MQPNFYLKTQKQNSDLYINLHGVFDCASAWELTNTIKKEYYENKAFYIDTGKVTQTYSLGKIVLDLNLSSSIKRNLIHFSGLKATDIMPEGCTLFKKHQCRGNCTECI